MVFSSPLGKLRLALSWFFRVVAGLAGLAFVISFFVYKDVMMTTGLTCLMAMTCWLFVCLPNRYRVAVHARGIDMDTPCCATSWHEHWSQIRKVDLIECDSENPRVVLHRNDHGSPIRERCIELALFSDESAQLAAAVRQGARGQGIEVVDVMSEPEAEDG